VNKVAKISSLVAALLLVVALVVVSEMQAPLSAASVEATLGQDYVSNTSAADNTILITVVDAAESTSVTSTITNLTSEATLDLTLTETGVGTGIFTGTVTVATTSASTSIVAADGEHVEATYTTSGSSPLTLTALTSDGVAYVVVDATGPTITNTAPADDTASRSQSQLFQAEVTDSASGVGADAAAVKANSTITVNGSGFTFVVADLTNGVWRVSVGLNLAEGSHTWIVTASDALGNTTTGTTDDLEIDLTPPTLTGAKTGDTADTSAADDAEISASSTRTSIRVSFDDIISGASVDADGTDFRVLLDNVDLVVSSASWTTGATTSKEVFLTLATDMPADATPVVRIVGDIQDDALNTTSIGEVTATDGLNPVVTVSITGTNSSGADTSSGAVTIQVQADEASTNPTISTGLTVAKADESGDAIVAGIGSAVAATTFTTDTSGSVWTWDFTFAEAADKGVYNVYVTISDGTNSGTIGHIRDATDDTAVVFEIDTGVAAVALTPTTSDNADSFVNLGYTGEGTEYTGDTHTTVTVSSATVDAVAVTANTVDSITYTIASPSGGWSEGDHEVIVTTVDGAANSSTETLTFTITDRAELSIALQPGLNLISLPGAATSAAINDVIPAAHPINQVLTYDPSVAGGWLVAERGGDGLPFAGTLTTMGPDLAYFVRTTTFEALSVLIPRVSVGQQVLPPSISLEAGWNLVPVVDVSGDLTAGATLATAEEYLPSTALRVFGLANGNLTSVDEDDDLLVGAGYWVYVSAASVLVP
jgi:hypothetical protein